MNGTVTYRTSAKGAPSPIFVDGKQIGMMWQTYLDNRKYWVPVPDGLYTEAEFIHVDLREVAEAFGGYELKRDAANALAEAL